ncbi:MAG: alpha/beta hydrolase [Bacteroidales bacterium]|nr:alpha/beta hydrolase [Bacteroidales bacterium]
MDIFRPLRKIGSYFYFLPLLVSCSSYTESVFRVKANGQDLFCSVRGPLDGKPVVLMHGNGGSHKSMLTQQLQLAKAGYRVYCPDSRGQGQNEAVEEYHYADMAEDCFCLIRELGLQKPVVGGWSDGGINALLLEMAHPGTCSMIVAAGANLYPDCGDEFEEFKEWILSEGTALALMMLKEPDIDPSELRKIKCPALITAGSRDLISVEHTTLIADSIPDSELIIFRNATHSSYIKRNPRLGRAMIDFMKRRNY